MKKKGKKAKPAESKPKAKAKPTVVEDKEDEFDFGGLPKDVSLTRNIGCGG